MVSDNMTLNDLLEKAGCNLKDGMPFITAENVGMLTKVKHRLGALTSDQHDYGPLTYSFDSSKYLYLGMPTTEVTYDVYDICSDDKSESGINVAVGSRGDVVAGLPEMVYSYLVIQSDGTLLEYERESSSPIISNTKVKNVDLTNDIIDLGLCCGGLLCGKIGLNINSLPMAYIGFVLSGFGAFHYYAKKVMGVKFNFLYQRMGFRQAHSEQVPYSNEYADYLVYGINDIVETYGLNDRLAISYE